MKTLTLETDHKIKLPVDWVKELGLESGVTLERTELETKSILTKVYDVDTNLASQQLSQFSAGPIEIIEVDLPITLTAMQTADALEIDITDAILLQATRARGANVLATDDRKLIQACYQVDIAVENPIDISLRRQMANREAKNLPQKGLPRILRRIHQWLYQNHQQASEDFWSQTGGGSPLP